MDPKTRITRRTLALSILSVPLLLAACGKKGDPQPPSGGKAPFPRQYPPRNPPPPLPSSTPSDDTLNSF